MQVDKLKKISLDLVLFTSFPVENDSPCFLKYISSFKDESIGQIGFKPLMAGVFLLWFLC